ncbi:MAG: zinc transport system ATP-binding protein [Clostridia bacterium]|nr:zinc transport system ATP-binding protein [Clostridia bacterium]
MSKIVELKGINYKIGGRIILEDINFSLAPGEFVGLVGPNGAGKTTLLRLILGLIKPSSGKVEVLGQDPASSLSVRRQIGYLPQRQIFDVNFPLTVSEAVFLALPRPLFFWRYNSRQKEQVTRTLDLLNLLNLSHKPLGQLSGGQQQLVFLARALVNRPSLLLLDEPVNGLDISAQDHFYNVLSRLQQELGLTVLVVSHDLPGLGDYAQRFILLNKTILAAGSPGQIIKQMATAPKGVA